jgi:hypothetical protein
LLGFWFLFVGLRIRWLIKFCVAHETWKRRRTQCWDMVSGDDDYVERVV